MIIILIELNCYISLLEIFSLALRAARVEVGPIGYQCFYFIHLIQKSHISNMKLPAYFDHAKIPHSKNIKDKMRK